jgi:hypothetical protein
MIAAVFNFFSMMSFGLISITYAYMLSLALPHYSKNTNPREITLNLIL